MITVSKETTPELFDASVVSVGLLGVVTQVTMEIVKDFNLHEVMTVSHSITPCENPCNNPCYMSCHYTCHMSCHSACHMSCRIYQIHVLSHVAIHVVIDVYCSQAMQYKSYLRSTFSTG